MVCQEDLDQWVAQEFLVGKVTLEKQDPRDLLADKVLLAYRGSLGKEVVQGWMVPEVYQESQVPRVIVDLMDYLGFLVTRDIGVNKVRLALQVPQERTVPEERMEKLGQEECKERVGQEDCWVPEDLLDQTDSGVFQDWMVNQAPKEIWAFKESQDHLVSRVSLVHKDWQARKAQLVHLVQKVLEANKDYKDWLVLMALQDIQEKKVHLVKKEELVSLVLKALVAILGLAGLREQRVCEARKVAKENRERMDSLGSKVIWALVVRKERSGLWVFEERMAQRDPRVNQDPQESQVPWA